MGSLGGVVGLALRAMRLLFLLLLGMPDHLAAGTAARGSIRHVREGRLDVQVVAVQGVPAVIGAFIAGFANAMVPEFVLIGLAGLLVVWQGGCRGANWNRRDVRCIGE